MDESVGADGGDANANDEATVDLPSALDTYASNNSLTVIGAAVSLATPTQFVEFGSDGGTISRAFSLGIGQNSDPITDGTPTGLNMSVGPQFPIFLFNDGGLLIGKAGPTAEAAASGTIIFAIHIDPTTGTVSMAQYRAVKHDDPNDHDESTSPAVFDLNVKMVVTATDGDGDTDVATRSGVSISFNFEDDGPDVEIVGTSNSVNEGQVVSGTWTLDGGSDAVTVVDVTIGSVTKQLTISGSGTELVTIGAGDGFPHGTLIVRDNLTWEFTANANTGDQTFDFSIKATDRDANLDSDSHTITIIDDNEPAITAGPNNVALDEDGFAFANADAAPLLPTEFDGNEFLVNTGTVTVDFGDDAPAGLANLLAAFDFINFAALDGQLQTLDGDSVTFALVGDDLVGSTSDGEVITIEVTNAVDNGSGVVTYTYQATLSEPLKHPTNHNEDLETLTGVQFQVTDNDGDQLPAPGSFDVTIRDDVPLAVNDGNLETTAENVTGLTVGTVAEILGNDSFGADGQGTPEVTIGAGNQGGTVNIVGGNLVYTNTTANATPGIPVIETFVYTIKDGDGDTTTASFTVTLEDNGLLVVGSNENDDPSATNTATFQHTEPNPSGPLFGVINGDTGDDILIGDPGAQGTVTPGDTANIVFVLDTSSSMNEDIGDTTRIEAMIDGVKAALDALAATGAGAIRVHIVQFDLSAGTVGTFDILGGTPAQNATALANAKAAVDGLISPLGAGTNYEAGLQGAIDWMEGDSSVDPLAGADIEQVIFVSDGEPNRVLDGNSTDFDDDKSEDQQSALEHIVGDFDGDDDDPDDTVNEINVIETTHGFTIQAVGIDVGSGALDNLDDVEDGDLDGGDGDATNITTPAQLTTVLAAITGGSNNPAVAGSDDINGLAGNDIIFGDVMKTDALADAQGLATMNDAGWQVFDQLENGLGTDATWDRADTVAYIQANHFSLSGEMPRTGGHDEIAGGLGNDIVYAQEGNDIVRYSITGSGTDGTDFVHGGTETTVDTFEVNSSAVGAESYYIETVAAYEARTLINYAVPAGIPIAEADLFLVSRGTQVLAGTYEIEHVVINAGGGDDTLFVSGDFTGTDLLNTTMVFNGGDGNDTVNLLGRDVRASRRRVRRRDRRERPRRRGRTRLRLLRCRRHLRRHLLRPDTDRREDHARRHHRRVHRLRELRVHGRHADAGAAVQCGAVERGAGRYRRHRGHGDQAYRHLRLRCGFRQRRRHRDSVGPRRQRNPRRVGR